jgi:hypothetical protein
MRYGGGAFNSERRPTSSKQAFNGYTDWEGPQTTRHDFRAVTARDFRNFKALEALRSSQRLLLVRPTSKRPPHAGARRAARAAH